jgi:hypothetical protein
MLYVLVMEPTKSDYSGPERRVRRVYITQNHEYHCKEDVCVAVRDIRSGEFLPRHSAVGKKVTGALVFKGSGIESISPPADATPGQRMHFAIDVDDRTDVLTSALKSVERPPRDIVAQYDRALR